MEKGVKAHEVNSAFNSAIDCNHDPLYQGKLAKLTRRFDKTGHQNQVGQAVLGKKLIEIAIKNREFGDAKVELAHLLATPSKLLIKPLCHLLLEEVMLEKNYPLATEIATLVLRHFPEDQAAKLALAQSYLSTKAFEQAIPYFPLLAEHYAHDGDMIHQLAKACEQLGHKEQARNYSMKALQLYEKSDPIKGAEIAFERGNYYLSLTNWMNLPQPDYAKAIPYLEKAWRLNPQQAEYKEKCFQTLQKAIQARTWSWGNFLSTNSQGHLDAFYQMAAKLAGEVPGEHVNQVIAAHEKNREFAKAVQFYEQNSKTWPDTPFAISALSFFNYAEQLLNAQDFPKALNYYQKGFQKDKGQNQFIPGFAVALFETALTLDNLEAKEERLKQSKELWSIKKQPAHLVAKMDAELLKVRLTLAESFEKQCLHIFGTYGRELREHKLACKPNAQKAANWYLKALELAPQDSKLHFQRAELLFFFDIDPQEALKEYRLAVKGNKQNRFYRRMLGTIYQRLGNQDKAEYHYQKENEIPIDNARKLDVYHWFEGRFMKDEAKAAIVSPH